MEKYTTKFYGSHEFLMDDKGRVTIPSSFKRLMTPEDQDTLVMTRGLDGCVFAYPLTAWDYYVSAMRRMRVPTDDRLKVMRIILAWAVNCTFDKQGRLKIPTRLAKHARINREVMLVGHQDRIEIWNKQVYETYHDDTQFDYEKSAKRLFVDMMPGAEFLSEELQDNDTEES